LARTLSEALKIHLEIDLKKKKLVDFSTEHWIGQEDFYFKEGYCGD
jgi:hypothetical protein